PAAPCLGAASGPSHLPRGAGGRRTAGEPAPTAAGGEGRGRRRGSGRAHRRGEAEACRRVPTLRVRRRPPRPPRGGARGEAGAAAAAGSGGARPGSARLGAAGSAGRSVAAMRHLPYFCRGEVVKGFGRGSKELGVPTDALIAAIQEDIEEAKRQLDLPEHLKVKEDNFFHLPGGKIVENR
uniref:riboflavin kinase n=1 Tax=Gallus gallus TaxID=9031 RepID=A0A8V0YZM4_CHICK